MKKETLWKICLLIILIAGIIFFFSSYFDRLTGKIISEKPENAGEKHTIGPSQEEQACMKNCMNCDSFGVNCTGNQEECMVKCNSQKPEATTETSCMEECVKEGCSEFDFSCQTKNQEKCEKQCNMIKAPDESEMSAEQLCITNCVNAESPGTICQASQTGETGNEICQKCAASCVHLYAGPCLNDEKLKAKQKECETCEHCYGEPIMGDSGEGWECIVNVECKDASAEFGDTPGTGPGIIEKTGEAIGNVFEAIGDFFGNIFSKEEA
jgi:hypothetical protein